MVTEDMCNVVFAPGRVADPLLEHVPARMRTASLCHAAVHNNGQNLAFVPESVLTEALCMTAVQQDGYALCYVPEAMRTDAILLVVAQHPLCTLSFLLPDHPELHTEALCRAAVEADARELE